MNNIFNQIRARCLSVNWRDTPIILDYILDLHWKTPQLFASKGVLLLLLWQKMWRRHRQKRLKHLSHDADDASERMTRICIQRCVPCVPLLYFTQFFFFLSLYYSQSHSSVFYTLLCMPSGWIMVDEQLCGAYWMRNRKKKKKRRHTYTNNFCVLNISWSWYYR